MIKNDDSPTNSQVMIDKNIINENSLHNNSSYGVDNNEELNNNNNNNNNSSNNNNNNNNNNSNNDNNINDNSYLFPLESKENMGAYIIGSTIPLIKERHQLEQQQQKDQKTSPVLSSGPKKLKSKYKNSPPLLSSTNDDEDDDGQVPQTYDLDTEIPRATISSVTASPTIPSIKNMNKSSLGNNSPTAVTNSINNNHKVEKQENLEENGGEDMLLIDRMIGYQSNLSRELVYWMSVVFTVGVSLLIYYWFELLYINIRFKKLSNVYDATHVLVYSQDSRFEFCKVNHLKDEKYLIYRFSRFFFNEKIQEFEKSKINNLYEKSKLLKLIESGLDNNSYKDLKQRFGKNEINFPVKNIPRLLMEEVLHPFFIFQIYSVCLWMAEQYYYYAVAILIIASVSAVVSLREVRNNLMSLQKISHFTCPVNVLRSNGSNGGTVETISSTELVPGDIIELSQDFIMPCDVILLSGQAILNESMLTGESIPVNKYSVLSDDDIKFQKQQQRKLGSITEFADNSSNSSYSFDDEIKDLSKEKRSLIYGGTVIVKLLSSSNNGINDKVLGMVRDTSFQTTKGKLILSILFPKKSHFKFFVESLKFVGVLCCLALVGFSLSVWRLKTSGENFHIIALRALDLITIVIPPALPMAMTVGTGFGLNRLRKSKIFCISPPRLNMAGKIQVFCFDKTGTLTEEGLDLLGILSTTPIMIGTDGCDTSIGGKFLSTSQQSSSSSFNHHNKSMSIPSSPSISSRSSDAINNGHNNNNDQQMLFSLTSSTPTTPNLQSASQLMAVQQISNSCNGYTFDQMNDPNQSSFNSNQNIFRILMASCHSLSVINGTVSGDPLEIKIFESTKSTIIDGSSTNGGGLSGQTIQLSADQNTNQQGTTISYLENFDFQSKLQRMSVIVQLQSSSCCLSLVKGSPEMIKGLCIPITIPKDYDRQLAIYTEKGYRVLACAYKPWDPNVIYPKRDILRKESESNLQFLGFIIMENRIKSQSPTIINTLQKANIRTIMVTGDNGLTATSVAKQCGIIKNTSLLFIGLIQHQQNETTNGFNEQHQEIVWERVSQEEGKNEQQDNTNNSIYQLDPNTLLLDDESRDYNLIITGPVFKQIYANYLATGSKRFINMLRRGVVYARMTPDEKQSLVEELERVGLYVGMCGDGANDCGALKAAHVGISLSESEASIAAPFTSTVTDISCCPTLIKEGRASLAVSFKLFQFMGMYSLIQFTSVIFLYFHRSVLGNWQYLYQDLIVIFPLVVFLGMTQPCNKLSIKRPSGRLISGAIIGSLFAHILVCVSFQVALYFLVQSRSWFDEPVPWLDELNIRHYITTTLFIFGSFQYSIMLLTFSFGKPFLKQLYTNRYLFIAYLFTLSTNFILLFGGWFKLSDFLQLRVVPVNWRFTIFGFLVGNLIFNVLVEFSFYTYKLRSKKKKVLNITKIFTKDQDQIPIDNRITENSVLIPVHNQK